MVCERGRTIKKNQLKADETKSGSGKRKMEKNSNSKLGREYDKDYEKDGEKESKNQTESRGECGNE